MKWKISAPLIVLLAGTRILAGQTSPHDYRKFDNPYLTITILREWTVASSENQTLNLVKGKYLLAINPVFTHASPVEGGRFSEIVAGMPSVDAVMRDVDQPASGAECTLDHSDALNVTKSISLGNFYTDSSKTGNGCVFPSSGGPVWFGAFSVGEAPESEYTIKLSCRTDDVNSLPKKGSADLNLVFTEVVEMLKTLRFKRPVTVTGISPRAAPPGATVTLYGTGFNLNGQPANVAFSDLQPLFIPDLVVAQDGKWLTFQVPASVETVSCQEGRLLIGGFCLAIPPNHVNVNDCPRDTAGGSNICGIPIPPGTYEVSVGGMGLNGDSRRFTVTAPKPGPVSITLIYPIYLVLEGYTITVCGGGFTASGNSVRLGDAVVNNLQSPDGKTLTFRAPEAPANSLVHGRRVYNVSVSNANGVSNSISLEYR